MCRSHTVRLDVQANNPSPPGKNMACMVEYVVDDVVVDVWSSDSHIPGFRNSYTLAAVSLGIHVNFVSFMKICSLIWTGTGFPRRILSPRNTTIFTLYGSVWFDGVNFDAEWNYIMLLVVSPTNTNTSASELVSQSSIHPLRSSLELAVVGTFPTATTITGSREVHI